MMRMNLELQELSEANRINPIESPFMNSPKLQN